MGFLETKRYQGFKETGSVSDSAAHSNIQQHTETQHRYAAMRLAVTTAAVADNDTFEQQHETGLQQQRQDGMCSGHNTVGYRRIQRF
jgi:hypothetical protein